MKIKITVYSVLREVFGAKSVEIDIPELGILDDVINELEKKYGTIFKKETGRNLSIALKNRFEIYLDGKRIRHKDSRIKLKKDTKIIFLNPVAGG
jgi:molybdopterin converting factor small subunit